MRANGYTQGRRSAAFIAVAALVGAGLGVVTPQAVPSASALTIVLVVNQAVSPYGRTVGPTPTFADQTDANLCLPAGAAPSCDLRSAMKAATTLLSGGVDDVTISIPTTTVTSTLVQPPGGLAPALFQADVPAGRTLTLAGPQGNPPVIDGQGTDRLFVFTGAGDVMLRDLVIRNGAASSVTPPPNGLDGAGILTSAPLSLERVTMELNRASGAGGAIRAGSNLRVFASTIGSNLGDANGGGISISGGTLTVDSSSITDNTNGGGGGQGGGIACIGCTAVDVVAGSVISGNNGRNDGGGVNMAGGVLTVDGSRVTNNSTFNGSGAGIYAGAGTQVVLRRATITGNDASFGSGNGGGVYCLCVNVTIDDSEVSNNTAFAEGGGVYAAAGTTFFVTNSTFDGNDARFAGGAVWCDCGDASIDNSTFTRNSLVPGAGLGGGALFARQGESRIERSVFDGNVSGGNGGAIAAVGTASLDISTVVVTDNVASNNGGGISCSQCDGVNLRASTIARNTANQQGGGLLLDVDGQVIVDNVTITGNTAGTNLGSAISVFSETGIGTVDLSSLTVAGNAGTALHLNGTSALVSLPSLSESILADNGVNCSQIGVFAAAGLRTSGTLNVIEGGGCTTDGGSVTTDPGLSPLGVQGGPARAAGQPMPVMAITGTSVASNLTDCAGNTFDARGFTRPTVACDAGAFELDLTARAVVAAGVVPSPAAVVSLARVPNSALTPPVGNGSADSQPLTTAQVRGIDLAASPLRNIPLRNIGFDTGTLSRDVLESISLAQIPLTYKSNATWVDYLNDVGLVDLARQPLNTISLYQLLQATANLPGDKQLALGQLDLSDTSLGSIGVGALGLAGASLTALAGSYPVDWCGIIDDFTTVPCGAGKAIDPATATLVSIALEGVPLRNIPLRNIPLRNIDLESAPLRNIPLRNIPLRNIDLDVSPLRNIPLRNIPLRNIPITDAFGNPVDIGAIVVAPLRNIPLRNIDLAASPLRNIPLRNIPLRNITVPGVGGAVGATVVASPLRNIPLRNIPLRNIDLNPSPLRNIPLRNIDLAVSPLRNIPLRNIPLRNIPLRNIGGLEASPLRNIPLRDIDLAASPLRNIPLRDIAGVQAVVDCSNIDCSSTSIVTLGAAVLLPGVTLGQLADAVVDGTDLGLLGDIRFAESTLVFGDVADAFGVPGSDGFTLEALFDVFVADLGGVYTLADLAAALQVDPIGLRSILDLLYDAFTVSDVLDILLAEPVKYGIDPVAASRLTTGIENLTIDQLIGLLALLEPPVTLADLFLGVFSPEDYPWENLDLDAAADGLRTATDPVGVPFAIDVTSTLPGGTPMDVTIDLPAGFTFIPGSLSLPPGATDVGEPTVTTRADRSSQVIARVAMPEIVPGGSVRLGVRVLPPLEVGTSSDLVGTVAVVEWATSASTTGDYTIVDALEDNDSPVQRTNLPAVADNLVLSYVNRPGDVDWFGLQVQQGQQLSIILSNLPTDYDMLLFGPAQSTTLRGAPLRALVPAADNGLSLLGDDAVVAQIGPDVDTTPPAGMKLVEGSAGRGAANERIDTGALAPGSYLVMITGYNGANSPRPYALRARVVGQSLGQACPNLTPAPIGAALDLGSTITTIGPNTDTLVLVDSARLQRSYPGAGGAPSADGVVGGLQRFTTALAAESGNRFGGTRAAVVDLARVPAVRTANAAWDQAVCDPEAANRVVRAIGTHLDSLLTPNIENVVIIGADDQIPMARLRDNTPAHNESEYATTWTTLSPVAAAQSLGYMLSDDPYGTANPFTVGPRELFVPVLSVGRLVESPSDIVRALDNFVQFEGRLDPTTAISTGYDFLEDGARAVASELRNGVVSLSAVDTSLINTGTDAWTRADILERFAQAGPAIASVNAHFDHYRLLPADQDAQGRLTDPLTLAGVAGAPAVPVLGSTNGATERPLERSIIFSMGCHGGLSVSDISVGALSSDWAQTFGGEGAAAFAGNTGYGYGDTVTVAFSEELMRLFAARLGQAPTIGQAMTAAKQRYVSDLVVVSPFEEKVTSQVVFYGLPMYRIAGATPPVAPPPVAVAADPISGLPSSVRSIDLEGPNAISPTSTVNGTYYSVGGEVQATAYQPVQPRTSVDVTGVAGRARGAIITGLRSVDIATIDPAIVTPTDDAVGPGSEAPSREAVFPSVLQKVATVNDLTGVRDRLVVVPGQFRGLTDDPAGRGVQRLFTTIDTRVFYAPAGNTDTTAPTIIGTDAAVVNGNVAVQVKVSDGDVARVVVLYVESDAPNPKVWRQFELATSGAGTFVGVAPVAAGATTIDYFVQVLDTGGNVSTSSDKGTNFRAAVAPLVPPQPNAPTVVLSPNAPTNGTTFTGSVTVTAQPSSAGQEVSLIVNGVAATNPVVLSANGVYTVQAVAAGFQPVVRQFAIDDSVATLAISVSPAALANGWHIAGLTPVKVAVAKAAGSSALASISVTVDSTTAATTTATTAATTGSATLSADGDYTVTATGIDDRGRTTAPVSVRVRIDTTRPVITCPAVPTFILNQPNALMLATVSGGTVPSISRSVSTAAVNTQSVLFTAFDAVGNEATKSCDYVVRYRVQGFFDPIDPTALNVANAGRTIAVTWRLTDFAGAPVVSASSFLRIVQTRLATCGSLPPEGIDVYVPVTASSLQYLGGGNWQYNWKTDRTFRDCRTLRVELADGSRLTATFQFR